MVILDIQIELFMSNFFPEVQASDYLKSGNSDSAGTKSSNIEWAGDRQTRAPSTWPHGRE